MGEMTLIEVINGIKSLDGELTLYLKPPFNLNSICYIAMEPEDSHLPDLAIENGAKYFLEVFLVQELCEDLSEMKLEQKTQRIIDYVENDA